MAIIEHYAKRENPPSTEAILHRMLLAMVLEATLILQEKKRLDPREIDLGMICGLGFPRIKADCSIGPTTIGAPKILEMVESFGTARQAISAHADAAGVGEERRPFL